MRKTSMEWRVLVLLLLCSQPMVSHCGMHSDVARMKAVVVDVVSSLDVLLATSCRSLTTCAATCLRDHRSVAFTVTRDTVSRGQRLCRCHSASIQEGLTDSIPGPHARLYEFIQRVEPGDGDSQASQTGQGDTSTQLSQTGQSVESTENNHAGQSDITTQSSQVRISDEITPSNEDRKVDESTQGGQRSPAYAAPTTINTLTSLTISTTQTASTSPTTTSVSSSTSITSLTATASSQTGEWLYKTCTNDSWCHSQYDLNTLCVNNFCVCKPGFYYSTGGNTCVSTCLDKDVLNDMLDYPNHVITFPLTTPISVAESLDVCKDACYSNVRCRFFNYCKIIKMCFFFILTSTTVTWPSLQQSTNCSVYIRTCA